LSIAIDFHCHGVGDFDLSFPSATDLFQVDKILKLEGIAVVLVFSLPQQELENFEALLETYRAARQKRQITNILGIALEGPVLSLVGGTPESGCWNPTRAQWQRIAALGPKGLVYCVLSPDCEVNAGESHPEDIGWVARTLSRQGVMPALGHFQKHDPKRSAVAINEMCDGLARSGLGPVITDHLFNDMPLNFKHCWRTAEERSNRAAELAAILDDEWSVENIEEKLGPVPAAMVRQAWRGNLKVCLNFDGDHVDIDICKKAVELIGAENVILMTDRIAGRKFGGRKLSTRPDNTLLYQDQRIVAGGTQTVVSQLGNMLRAGIGSEAVYRIAFDNPRSLLRGRHADSRAAGLVLEPAQ
jgi:N-acetylglucosamine-6-phosphate deacetylase